MANIHQIQAKQHMHLHRFTGVASTLHKAPNWLQLVEIIILSDTYSCQVKGLTLLLMYMKMHFKTPNEANWSFFYRKTRLRPN